MIQHRWLRIGFAISICVIVLCAGLTVTSPLQAAAIDAGDLLPSHTLYDLGENAYDLAAQTGAVVLIAFLGASCGETCVDIARSMQENIASNYRSDELRLFVVDALDGGPDQVAHFESVCSVRFPILMNGSQFLSECDLPWLSFLIVDTEGRVRYISEGPDPSAYDLPRMIEEIDRYIAGAASVRISTWGEIKGLYSR